MAIPDPIKEGVARGGKVAASPKNQADITCDVVIIGTGAGGGVSAELLTKAGLDVVLIEEGMLKSSSDFKMREADAYPQLYQESAARKTKDKAINILQGRAVGGSTTVNWTSSFRTPHATQAYWREKFGLSEMTPEALGPFFSQAETRLGIGAWLTPPNENNDLLKRGAAKLGIPAPAILRNVRGCWNLGYCGMGCPTNAKQSMLVTTLPFALDRGARLFTRCSAQKFEFAGNQVQALLVQPLDAPGLAPEGNAFRIKAKHYVLAGGAINSPGVLLRSAAPDPHKTLGARTFLHPVVISSALMEQKVEGYAGAPQTIYSDHFLDSLPIDGEGHEKQMGYKLEAPPLHPVLFASTVHGFGQVHADIMADFSRTHALLALLRDGFHAESTGGKVELRKDGSPVLDYPISDYVWDGARRALLSMAEIQFAAGAKRVYPVHEHSAGYATWQEAKTAITNLPMKPLITRVVSAHVMGGAGMAAEANKGVTRPDGRHWQIENLSVFDGSLFPTSIGANPQLSIYGLTTKLASRLAAQLSGKPAPRLDA
ncbi:MAG: GMC family oxidoreductase N-terminal domain-containing protein [Burkholderiaceae bacterium]